MKSIVISIVTLLLFSCGQSIMKVPEAVKTLPAITFLLQDSITVFNTSQLKKDRPIVIIYYDPDCKNCTLETESLMKNMEKMKEIQFVFLSNADIRMQRDFYQKFNFKEHSNIIAGIDKENSFKNLFNLRQVPSTAIYDKKSNLVVVYVGATDIKNIIKAANG